MTVIRYARAADNEGILRTLAEAFEPYRTDYADAAFRDTVLDPEALRERMSRMAVLVAERGGEIIGTIAAGQVDADDGHLRGMAVSPSAEGSGAGRMLLRRALDELTAAGCRRVTLDTTEYLVRAQRFYERAGFTRTGRVADFFGMPLYEYAAPLDAAFVFREARPDEATTIRDLVNAAYVVEHAFIDGDRLDDEGLRSCFETGTFLVAAGAGEPPSACIFLRPNGDRRTYLGVLAVNPALQRRRFGSLMMTAAERRCRLRGDVAIDISVVNLRTELPPIYRARGFVETGTGPFENPRLVKPAHLVHMVLALSA
jgi:ribosomal protein S18 acetylase RimI-like enzyme